MVNKPDWQNVAMAKNFDDGFWYREAGPNRSATWNYSKHLPKSKMKHFVSNVRKKPFLQGFKSNLTRHPMKPNHALWESHPNVCAFLLKLHEILQEGTKPKEKNKMKRKRKI